MGRFILNGSSQFELIESITPWLTHGGTTRQDREQASVLPWNDSSPLSFDPPRPMKRELPPEITKALNRLDAGVKQPRNTGNANASTLKFI